MLSRCLSPSPLSGLPLSPLSPSPLSPLSLFHSVVVAVVLDDVEVMVSVLVVRGCTPPHQYYP